MQAKHQIIKRSNETIPHCRSNSHDRFIEVSGKVILSSPGEDPATILASWKIITESGRRSKVRVRSRDGIALEAVMDPIVGPDGYLIHLQIAIEARIKEEVYSTETGFTIASGHTKALSMGVDATNGRDARIEISVNLVDAFPRFKANDMEEEDMAAKIAPLLPK